MLHEYAIEPAALTRFETSRYILEKMGIPNGRYIADFPAGWFNFVRQACNDDEECLPIARQKIVILLKKASQCVLSRYYRYYDSELDWLKNAENGHAEAPFHAIFARENPREHASVLPVDEITEEHPLLAIPRENITARTATELLNVALPFLELSNEIIFVDGYFNPLDLKYQNTTRAFLTAIKNAGNTIRRLEFHTRGDRRNDGLANFEDFRQACIDQLSGYLPHNTQLKVFRWNQRTGGKRFHARYILTNLGGMRIDSGMDEAFDAGYGRTEQDTEVTLMDYNVHEEIWSRFSDPSKYFDRSDNDCVEVK